MTKQDLGTLSMRLFGVYCLVKAFPRLRDVVSALVWWLTTGWPDADDPTIATVVANTLFPFVLMVVLGIVLLRYSSGFGRRLVPDSADEPLGLTAPFDQVQAIAFSAVGALVACLAIPYLCNAVGQLWFLRSEVADTIPGVARMSSDSWISLVSGALQLLAGVALFLGARNLSALWHKLRTAGTKTA